MEIKVVTLISILRSRGHSVKFYRRPDGSYRITEINGVTYTGSTGNKVARQILGVKISEKREKQLERIRTPKKAPLPHEVDKRIRRVQRLWKKNKVQREGYVGRRGARYNLEHYGEEETLRKLSEQERYARGLAYTETIQWIIDYIRDQIIPKVSPQDKITLKEIISLIENNKSTIKESDISPIHDYLYDFRDGKISALEAKRRIESILE